MTHKIPFVYLIFSLLVGCSRSTGNVLFDSFSGKVTKLTPEETIDLEQFGILMPSDLIKYDDSFIIKKGQSKNIVDILTPSTGEVISCFRKGRGPGEIINPSSFQRIGDTLFLYDITAQQYYALDLKETIESKKESIEEYRKLNVQANDSIIRPYILRKIDDCFVSTGIFKNTCWFVLIDHNNQTHNGADYLDYQTIEGFSNEAKSVFHISNFIDYNPSKNRFVCAFKFAEAFSICEFDGHIVNEVFREQTKNEPKVIEPTDGAIIAYRPEHTEAFQAVCTDENYIYLLYSGKSVISDSSPSDLGQHILVYDWDGKPIKHLLLDEEIGSMYLENEKIYCSTNYPEPQILVYDMTRIL